MARSELAKLAACAWAINARHGAGQGLPPLVFFTDPARVGDPVAAAARLPRGAGVVFRHFGIADREAIGRRLMALCRRRGLRLIVGADAALARRLRADGVHLPEREARQARRLRRRFGLVTVAAHTPAALRLARGADAAVLSAVFASDSASAGAPLGPGLAGQWARSAKMPVYALGGVAANTVKRLRQRGFCGVAAVSGVLR